MPLPYSKIYIEINALIKNLDEVIARYKDELALLSPYQSEYSKVEGGLEGIQEMKFWLEEQIKKQKNT